jgi:hypothetical protein
MGDVTKLDLCRPRKLSQTVYTDRGSRLVKPVAAKASRWFLPALVILPGATFFAIIFW